MALSRMDEFMTHRRTILGALTLTLACAEASAVAGERLDCTILLNAADGRQLAHEGHCDERITPASTFKIALSLMGFDSGVLVDEHHPVLPWRKGYVDWRPSWRAPTDPARWMRESVIWYSQQTVRQLGPVRWQAYVDRFDYGNRDVSGQRGADGLSMAWVNGSLRISPDEEAAFLRKVVNRELGLAPRAYEMTARILRQPVAPRGWTLYGKTGSGAPTLPNGDTDDDHPYGWFVGWATKGTERIVFVRMAQDRAPTPGPAGVRVRDAFLAALPAYLRGL
jgi:bla regulator protein BlaR1